MAEEIFERRTAFNAGEISPWLDPRIDQEKYHKGCRQMRNMRPTIYGGAFRRAGTEYLGEARVDSGRVRLLSFEYEVGTAFVLELTALKLRIWTTGNTPALVEDPDSPGDPLVVNTPWTAAQLDALQVCQQNDLLFVVHPNHQPRVIARYANNDWRVVRYNPDWPALREENDRNLTLQCTAANATPAAWSNATTYDAGDEVIHEGEDYASRHDNNRKIEPGDHPNWKRWWRAKDGTKTLGMGRRVTVSASKNLFQAGHVGTKWVLTWRRDELKENLFVNTVSVGHTTSPIYCLGEWSASLLADNSGSGDWDAEVTVQRSFNGKVWRSYRVISASRAEVQQLVAGSEPDPCFLRLKLTKRTGASLPSQYKGTLEVANPDQHGIVRIRAVTNATTATGTLEFPVPDSTTTKFWQEPAWSEVRGFPRAVTLHEGRLWFGGTKHQPTTFWASGPDRFGDFRLGPEPDRGLEFQVQSDEANAIQWMLSHEALLIGTKGAEWFYGQRPGEDLPKLRRNSSYGSAPIQAKMVNTTAVMVQRSQRKLREIAPGEGGGYAVPDLTLLAEHFGDAKFLQLAVQRNPDTIVWILTDQGDLIGLLYERDQEVAGWFRYATSGRFQSLAVVEGSGEEDQLWVAVRRTVDGVSKRYIERFQPDIIRQTKEEDQADLIFSDAAKVRTGALTQNISGLGHLEGRTVSVLADGAPHPNKTVSGGAITLDWRAQKVIVGLPFTSLLEPTYLETMDPGSITKAFKKRITRAAIEFWKSLGCEVSADGGATWHPIEFRQVDDKMDEVPRLFSGIKEEMVNCASERQATVILRQRQPLPLNVLSLVIRFVVGPA